MRELLEYIIKQLVNNPDKVSIEEERRNGEVNFVVSVDPSDMGIVIGKSGQTIKAIRRVVIVRAIGDNVKVNISLKEPAGGSKPQVENQETTDEATDETDTEKQEETPVEQTDQETTDDTTESQPTEEIENKN